jgi:endonuclease/exonuclease/phosphatase family metal-dependent hydrolase
MRRIALALGPVFALVATAPVISAHSATPEQNNVVTTRAPLPGKILSAKGVRGPRPGETTIRWRTDGGRIDLYRITTALTPFGSARTPAVGRHSVTFTVWNGDRRRVTLHRHQTALAGAGLATGRHLFFRIKAVRKGQAGSRSRPYRQLGHAAIKGRRSTMPGTRLRYGAYNMHVQSKDIAGHPWKDRQRLIARNIARANPAVMGLEELMPSMWTADAGGIGLQAALRRTGVGTYRLTRETGYFSGSPQDTRILYDSDQVRMTSYCDTTNPSCYISLPNPAKRHVAAYARFKDLASGQEFYFVSAHLTAGNDAATDALRGRQAEAIARGMREVNYKNLPVVFASDCNSSQTSKGVDAPHTAMLRAGWYNTIAAANPVNTQYNSVNKYETQHPSPYGFGSMYDTIMTYNMPGADRFAQVLTGAPWPSDHNMVYADVRLP